MKKLSETLKISLEHLERFRYMCHAVEYACNIDQVENAEMDLALIEIQDMIDPAPTIPIWLEMSNIDYDYESLTDLRYVVISAWIDKLESEGK